MSDPIDFQNAHDKKHGPDAEFVYQDDRGQRWFKFTCSYKDEQDEYSFEIWALNAEDAQRRMVLISQSGKVGGQLFHEISA